MSGQPVLPGIPPPLPPDPVAEVLSVLRWRDHLAGIGAPDACEIEPLEPGIVAVPVALFERLVALYAKEHP